MIRAATGTAPGANRRSNPVRGLRLSFKPVDRLEAKGAAGRIVGPAARGFARRGLAPFRPLD
jgi:hypothetical protein